MSKNIVNLTLPVVVDEIESILATYPHEPYQEAFAIATLREKLTTYVLSRVHNLYVVVDDTQKTCVKSPQFCRSLEQQMQIETTIRNGIHQMLQEYSDRVDQHFADAPDEQLTPSYWFG